LPNTGTQAIIAAIVWVLYHTEWPVGYCNTLSAVMATLHAVYMIRQVVQCCTNEYTHLGYYY